MAVVELGTSSLNTDRARTGEYHSEDAPSEVTTKPEIGMMASIASTCQNCCASVLQKNAQPVGPVLKPLF